MPLGNDPGGLLALCNTISLFAGNPLGEFDLESRPLASLSESVVGEVVFGGDLVALDDRGGRPWPEGVEGP